MTQNVLYDLGSKFLLEGLNLEILEKLVLALKPIEVTVNAISEKEASLQTAYIAINFMREKLEEKHIT